MMASEFWENCKAFVETLRNWKDTMDNIDEYENEYEEQQEQNNDSTSNADPEND